MSRILITRPQAQAQKWQQCLQKAGFDTVMAPLMVIQPYTEADGQHMLATHHVVETLNQYQIVIFVSQNAVMQAVPLITRQWPRGLDAVDFLAVGKATGALLKQLGWPALEASGAMNTESLLELAPLQQLTDKRVVIFRGEGGRPLLQQQLQSRGAEVTACALYRRVFVDEALCTLLQNGWGTNGDIVSIFSGETLHYWDQIICMADKPEWRRLPLLIPGQRVYDAAIAAGFTQPIMAVNATDKCMLESLQQWRSQRSQE